MTHNQRVTLPTCACCGHNKPTRSLVLCRTCWAKLPRHVQLQAMKQAEQDPLSMRCAEGAARLIATAIKAVALKP